MYLSFKINDDGTIAQNITTPIDLRTQVLCHPLSLSVPAADTHFRYQLLHIAP